MAVGMGPIKVMWGLEIESTRVFTPTDDADPQVEAGSVVEATDGRRYKYVRFNEAATIGDCVSILTPDVTQTNLTAATATTSVTVTDAATFTAARYDNARVQWYYCTNGNTGAGQIRKVISNTADALTIDAAPGTALDTTTDGVVVSPYSVELTDATTDQVCGVALTAVTAGNYSWMQVRGFCPLIQFAGDANAAAAYQILLPSAAAGVATGRTAGGVTAAELEFGFGYALYPYAVATVDSRGIAGILNCRGM